MRKRIGWIGILLGVALWIAPAHAASIPEAVSPDASNAPAVNSPADAALAARLAAIARNTLQAKTILPSTWRQSAELLAAAVKLDPGTARYSRMLVDAMLQCRDESGAIEALRIYRQARPGDQVAQIKLIDLHLGRMETADAKLKYLQEDLLPNETIAREVRAYVATAAARILLDRGQMAEAKQKLDEALALNPLNLSAMRLRYATFGHNEPVSQRVTDLLGMIRSNPVQPEVMGQLAGQLADAGMVELSLAWYGRALGVWQQLGQSPDRSFATAYVAELYLADRSRMADSVANALLTQVDSTDIDIWFLGVMAKAQTTADKAEQDQFRQEAANAMLNRLQSIRHALGDAAATTRPVESTPQALPDLRGDASRIKAHPQLQDAYLSAVNDLAWFNLYFESDLSAAHKLIDAIKAADPGNSSILPRLEGWLYLKESRPAEAKVKLSAVAERDPVAAMGLIRLESKDPKTHARAVKEAAKLLRENPSGLPGALIYDGLRDLGVKPSAGADATGLAAILDHFPKQWLHILDQPQRFYTLRAEPLQVAHAFGEPILVKVTIVNNGTDDLTVGPEGVIHPDLWFDAQMRGLSQQALPGVAYDRLWGPLVMHGGESNGSISQIVRLDQGALSQLLQQNMLTSMQISADVMTNPMISRAGAAPAPAGYKADFDRIIQRNGYQLGSDPARQKLYQTLETGDPIDQMRAVELIAASTSALGEQSGDAAKALAVEFRDVVRRAADKDDPAVSAWSAYLNSGLLSPDQRAAWIEAMLHHQDWRRQLLGLVALHHLPVPDQKRLIASLAGRDGVDSIVKRYAAAAMESAQAASTQPASRPTAKGE